MLIDIILMIVALIASAVIFAGMIYLAIAATT